MGLCYTIGKILSDWETLGLSASPNVGENGVHASASPFEGTVYNRDNHYQYAFLNAVYLSVHDVDVIVC